jgi:imidazolonepropionase-like amidohydrolase
MAGPAIECGYLLAERGLIQAVGSGDLPEALRQSVDEVVDARGLTVTPGLIDAHCHVGLFNDGLGKEGEDGNEEPDPVTPQMLAIDGIYAQDRCFTEALAAGVTAVMTGPGSANVFSGQFALLQTFGRSADEMAISTRAALKCALGENPKSVHGAKDRSPSTRMATAAVIRETLRKALIYRDKLTRATAGEGHGSERPDLDVRSEALLPALGGEMLVKFHAHRADDILTAIRLANEFGLRYTLDHCTEGHCIADLLAQEYSRGQASDCGRGLPGLGRLEGVIVGPILSDRSKPELGHAEIHNAAVLAAAGLPVAIMTDHPVIPIQYLTVSAAIAVRGGLPEPLALQAITRTAARLAGVDDRLGTLEAGKQADLVLFDGDPLDSRTHVRRVLIAGQTVYTAEGY